MDEFKAETKTSYQMLCEPNEGFYIPPYQREYSWEKPKVGRLFEDAGHGVRLLFEDKDSSDATTFLGTIIVIHDTRYQTVDPKVQGDLPKSVQVVIDGQQRLATILLANIYLHDLMAKAARALQGNGDESRVWLYEQALQIQADLERTFGQEVPFGDEEYRWYPRMIRAYVDSWSRRGDTARYNSPIAACLRAYSSHLRGPRPSAFTYYAPQVNGQEGKKHNIILAATKEVKRQLKLIAGGQSENTEMPTLQSIASNTSAQESLTRAPFPESVVDAIRAEAAADPQSEYCQYMRVFIFARFWLDRIAMVYVTARTEDQAFDIFDALNTTGEPLTAFETFRPEVMKAEGLPKYEQSPSRSAMKEVEDVLDVHHKADQKRKATDEVLLPFAMAENGAKLSKRLNEQRVYLRRGYGRLQLSERRKFVTHLADAAAFVAHVWNGLTAGDNPPQLLNGVPLQDLTAMCLKVLRDANHHITVGLLLRFYSAIRSASPGDEREKAIAAFDAAVRAVTAFFAFWRGSRRGTKNIDQQYRRLMRDGLPEEPNFAAVPRLCRQGAAAFPNIDDLRRALRRLLAVAEDTHLTGKEDWVRLAQASPAYENSEKLSRFLLFAASEDATPDPESPGLVKRARPGTVPMLNCARWTSDLTVEHVWPKSRPKDGWASSLYNEPPEWVHCLGNLTLLPPSENSSLGAKGWPLKRLAFQVLSAESTDELNRRVAEASSAGLPVPSGLQNILSTSIYLPHLKSVAAVSGDWNAELVKSRSARIAELVWDRLSPWLGY